MTCFRVTLQPAQLWPLLVSEPYCMQCFDFRSLASSHTLAQSLTWCWAALTPEPRLGQEVAQITRTMARDCRDASRPELRGRDGCYEISVFCEQVAGHLGAAYGIALPNTGR